MRIVLSVAFVSSATGGLLRAEPPAAERLPGFDPPQVLLAVSEYRRLYPSFADIDGDGKPDLLVGMTTPAEGGSGRLLIYRNQGTKARPEYGTPTLLDGAVPTARIPDG